VDGDRLVGRRAELSRLRRLLDGARAGRGGAVMIEGTPGVGKSALLSALDLAGLRVLRTVGAETEIDLPFAGLSELVAPVVDDIESLPAPQRTALRTALAFEAPSSPYGEDRGLVLHAFAGLLAGVAPVVVVVDDVQWLDPSSEEAIAFAARRAERLGATFIVVRSLRGQVAEPWPGVEKLAVSDLTRADALRLAGRRGVGAAVAASLVDALGGNPLALTEAPALLTPEQRAGTAALPDPLPAGERMGRAFAERLSGLPERAIEAMVLLAASNGGAPEPLAAALAAGAGAARRDAAASLATDGAEPARDATDGAEPARDAADGAEPAPDAGGGAESARDAVGSAESAPDAAGGAEPARDAAGGASGAGDSAPLRAFAAAEAAHLVMLDPRAVRFTHPLVRTAVLAHVGPAALRAAHRALAATTPEPERAWHLAAAAEAPDEQLAASLEALAHDARGRGAVATAALVFERAARLSPDAGAAAGRIVTAAAMANVAGRPAYAKGLLDELLPSVADPLQRADVQLLRGMAMQQTGQPLAAFALLEQEAQHVQLQDPARAAGLLTQASITLMAYGTVERIEDLAARALDLAGPGADLVPAILHAEALVSLGEHDRARQVLQERAGELAALDPTGPGHEILSVAALCHLWMEDFEDAERLLVWLIDAARRRGAAAPLAFPLAVMATVLLRRGSFGPAMELALESQQLGEEAVGGFVHSLAVTAVAFVAAHQGDAARCLAACETARDLAERLELTSTLACVEQSRGFLALSEGDAHRAIGHLERAVELTARFGSRDPSFLYTEADLAEAYSRTGDTAAAARVAQGLQEAADRTGAAWTAAAAARTRALVAPDDDLDALRDAALAAHARVPLRFEEARTHLCLGERLRRARRRAEAREHLTRAHETFVALGSPLWARRAEQELAAAGARRFAATADGDDGAAAELTPRELEVCRLVAGGATNAEVAAQLFLSARTVEHHLRMAYRKLGVRSRSELASRFSDPSAASTTSSGRDGRP
jgi:DNA-binding CsgD family transcriptional regulator